MIRVAHKATHKNRRNNAGVFNLNGLVLLALFLLSIWIGGCAKKSPKIVIAMVNEHPVTIDELELLGRLAPPEDNASFESEAGQSQYRKIAPNLYNTLIDLYVLKYAAQEAGIKPSDEAVEAEFQKIKEALTKENQYQTFMKSMGLTEEKLRETIRDRLAMNLFQSQKLEEGQGQPTELEIQDYYNQNRFRFRYPARMRVSHIFIAARKEEGDEKRQQARKRAEQLRTVIGDAPAKTFVGLAQKFSDDKSTALRGGDLGFIVQEGMEQNESFRKAAFALKEGEVSGVVETDLGYHLIWATDNEESLEEAVKEIETVLKHQKMAEYFAKWLEEEKVKYKVQRLFDPETYTLVKTEKETASAKPSRNAK